MTEPTERHDTPANALATKENNLQIGALSGYNRRPIPTTSGLTCQFYGENGEDADLMSALNLTKFLETEAFLQVFLIKNALGQVMRDPVSGQYPLVASFSGKIQRPKPLRDGLMAQFFALNGEDADAVNELGKTKYLDAFVYVEILKPEARAQATLAPGQSSSSLVMIPPPSAELDALAHHLTPIERKEMAKRNKAYENANNALRMSGFFTQQSVWGVLGTEFDYQQWLEQCPCCASADAACKNAVSVFALPTESHERYAYVPLCNEHKEQATLGILPGKLSFLRLKQRHLIQMWAFEQLCKLLGVDKDQQPNPMEVFNWAQERKVSQYIPPTYLNFLK